MSAFNRDVLVLDEEAEIQRIAATLRRQVGEELRRRGAVVAVSGGIDSAVACGLAARALGPERICALLLPERDSSSETTDLGRSVVDAFGVRHELVDIAPALAAAGCYAARDDAIRSIFPEYDGTWPNRIELPGSILAESRLNVYYLTVQRPDGELERRRLTAAAYLQIVAATNFKQRIRKMQEYFWADKLQYAVVGTPNRLEYDQGFFVKLGDGAADVKPIAHLYKTQVFALGRALGVPDAVLERPPTTDTYSLPQSQEEFYFALPYAEMDLLLWAYDRSVPADQAAAVLDLTSEQVARVYRDIEAKRAVARYLHAAPLLVEPVGETV